MELKAIGDHQILKSISHSWLVPVTQNDKWALRTTVSFNEVVKSLHGGALGPCQ